MLDAFGLYLVMTEPVAGYETCTEAAVAEGVRYIQLRAKNRSVRDVSALAASLLAITRGSETGLIVNDDPVLACEVGAAGFHVGQDDMSVAEARRVAPGLIAGLSTHSLEQVEKANTQAPDYIGVGPVFPTPTKAVADRVLGLAGMARMVEKAAVPAVAIGGIDSSNLNAVLNAGAINFAVVRAVCASPEPRKAIRELMDGWRADRMCKNP